MTEMHSVASNINVSIVITRVRSQHSNTPCVTHQAPHAEDVLLPAVGAPPLHRKASNIETVTVSRTSKVSWLKGNFPVTH